MLALVLGPVLIYSLTRDDGSSAQDVAAGSPPDLAGGQAPSEPPSDSAAERVEQRQLAVYFGDSYFVSDFNYTNKSNTMARLSGLRLGYEKIRVRGAGGTGFAQANYDYDIPPYIQQIRAGALEAPHPDLVVIEGGSNDVTQPKWKVKRNAGIVLQMAHSQHPGAMLVLVGPLDPDNDYSDSEPINRALRKVAQVKGVPYIDDMRWLEGHHDLVGPDGVHPTAEGHRLLGRKLAKALAALGA